jgi:hypothetical protein
VVLSGAIPDSVVQFTIDGGALQTVMADWSGNIPAVNIAVPGATTAGTHTLQGVSAGGGETRTSSSTFVIETVPTPRHVPGPDVEPVEVPGALNADGSRNWVFQDLMPGGLGSWLMPRNPRTSNLAVARRVLQPHHTTAIAGQHHIFEALDDTGEWTFGGLLFAQSEHVDLEAYAHLNRRFYLIDHLNRAWVVGLNNVEVTPRLRTRFSLPGQEAQLSDWVAEYAVTATVYGSTWHAPVPL